MASHRFDRQDAAALLAVLGGIAVLASEWLLIRHHAHNYTTLAPAPPLAYLIAAIGQSVVLALLALTVRYLFADTDHDTHLKVSSTLTGAAALTSAVLPELASHHPWPTAITDLDSLAWTLSALGIYTLAAVLMFLIAWLLHSEHVEADA